MQARLPLLLALGLSMAGCRSPGVSQTPDVLPSTFVAGLVMEYTYPAKGASFRVEVLEGNRLRFVGTAGPMAGRGAMTTYASVSVRGWSRDVLDDGGAPPVA